MKYFYITILAFVLPFMCSAQESYIKVWEKTDFNTVGHATNENTISIGYEPINGYFVLLESGMGWHRTSLKFYGGEYEKFKKIIITYSEWRKKALGSNTVLEKMLYQTSTDFSFSENRGLYRGIPEQGSQNLKVMYEKGKLVFNIYENASYSNSITLKESAMIAIVGVFGNKANIDKIEIKAKNKSESWGEFKSVE